MKEHLKLLGLKVRTNTSGIEGIVTSICFDLNGCIMAAVMMQGKDDKGQPLGSAGWYDTKSVTVISKKPVQEQPTFDVVPGGTLSSPPAKDR